VGAIENGQILESHTSSCKNQKGSIGNHSANYKAIFSGEKLAPFHKHQECNIAATSTPQFTASCSATKPIYRPGCSPLWPPFMAIHSPQIDAAPAPLQAP
jgi:hypothetical protein